MLLGVRLTLLIGPTIAVPAPYDLTEALTGVEVTHSDSGRSGFQLTFQVGRSGPLDLADYGLLKNPLLLKPFNRVVIMVAFDVVPQVLMDGLITQVQLTPSEQPGASTLTVTGEDVSVAMDLHQRTMPHPSMAENERVLFALMPYLGRFQILPLVLPPALPERVPPTQRVPVQTSTDLAYIETLAERQGYVFFVKAGPAPHTNVAYWGPPLRGAFPPLGLFVQKALSVNMGPSTNVESINFHYNALAPTTVTGVIQDSELNVPLPVFTMPISTRPPLSLMPGLVFNQPNVRQRLLNHPTRAQYEQAVRNAAEGGDPQARYTVGLSIVQALARAQAEVNEASDNVVTASGSLDALQYGAILEARGLVGLRGAGFNYDGHYYVQSVTHSIRRGEYKQNFTLKREGTGSLTQVVRP
ncbi:MAG: hypothetical protein M3416_05270 [Acidobacteriota bacterium]|nr:hypothetical protein [Acidobacteriota bacterium]